MRALKKTKKDLEMQLKDQEEELDDLAAQVWGEGRGGEGRKKGRGDKMTNGFEQQCDGFYGRMNLIGYC